MKSLFTCLVITCLATVLRAGEQPFQASLTPEIALYPSTESISGLTLSIWGENPQHSLAIGFVNGTSGKSGGLSWGLVNYGTDYVGVQLGVVNFVKGDFTGWQDGVVNFTRGRVTGFQSGCVNYAGTLSGLQWGVVNVADKTDGGVQVGLVNVIRENTAWFSEFPREVAPVMILVNWNF